MSRARSGARRADPLQSGFQKGLATFIALSLAEPAAAKDLALPISPADYWQALIHLNRSEIAALALVLGVIFFAVVTAIMLVRTRVAAAQREAAFRNEIMTLTAEVDRVNTLLLSEPQIVIAWAAAMDEPEIVGDIGIVTQAGVTQRVLAFGSWL